MDVSSPGEHRRGRRVALVLALLALLLAAVAIASAGDTPLGSGGTSGPQTRSWTSRRASSSS